MTKYIKHNSQKIHIVVKNLIVENFWIARTRCGWSLQSLKKNNYKRIRKKDITEKDKKCIICFNLERKISLDSILGLNYFKERRRRK